MYTLVFGIWSLTSIANTALKPAPETIEVQMTVAKHKLSLKMSLPGRTTVLTNHEKAKFVTMNKITELNKN